MSNLNALAGYRLALATTGQTVTFRRVKGQAPSAKSIDATVSCIFRNYQPAAPIGQGARNAAISEGLREFIVLSADLDAQQFPLPLAKNDKIIVSQTAPAEDLIFNIVDVDPGTRVFAGAIQGKAVGV